MSDDEADPELLELLRQHLGMRPAPKDGVSRDTGVLRDAEHIYNNAIDVFIDMQGTKGAAASIYRSMQERAYSTDAWSQHPLHPTAKEGFSELDIVNFIFTMDLLNFSFWSEHSEQDRFQVDYKSKRWTGYNSLVAILRRALDEGLPITTPRFWRSFRCTDDLLKHAFRSATSEEMPLLRERIDVLRDASQILRDNYAESEDEAEEIVESEVEGVASINSGVIHEETSPAYIPDGTQPPHHLQSVVEPTSPIADPSADHAQPEPQEQALPGLIPVSKDYAPLEIPEPSTFDIEVSVRAAVNITAPPDETHIPEMTSGSGSHSEATSNGNAVTALPNDLPANETLTQPVDALVQSSQILGQNQSLPFRLPSVPAPDHTVVRLIQEADRCAGKLVNLLAKHFPCFQDETRFEGKRVRLLKRAQIFVADLWAAFGGIGLGEFEDIDHLTMFADYRVPQMLNSLGVLLYSPPLDHHIRSLKTIESGHNWELQLRGCSIWAVELIRREILKAHPEAALNAVLIDFFLYDLAKEREQGGLSAVAHRTRSIWY